MNQKVLFSKSHVSHSSNGLQGMTQRQKDERAADVSTTQRSSDIPQMSGVECDIAEGSKRVSCWLYGAERRCYPEDGGERAAEESATQETEEPKSASADMDDSSIEYLERLLESIRQSRENDASQKTKPKRALNYNYRKVSGAIMRAKSVAQAGNALASAKSVLSNLQGKSSSGQYDSNELGIAVSHARKMVRAARKKLQNIKLEEQQKRTDDSVENHQEREQQTQKRMQKGSHTAENAQMEKEILQLKKDLRQSRNQKQNSHRREENQALFNADMEYLKRKIELMRQERMASQIARLEAASLQQAIAGGVAAGTDTIGNGGGAAEATGSVATTGVPDSVSDAGASAATVSGGFDQMV